MLEILVVIHLCSSNQSMFHVFHLYSWFTHALPTSLCFTCFIFRCDSLMLFQPVYVSRVSSLFVIHSCSSNQSMFHVFHLYSWFTHALPTSLCFTCTIFIRDSLMLFQSVYVSRVPSLVVIHSCSSNQSMFHVFHL